MSLGQRIRHLRQSRGLTQSELGGGKLSKSFISLIEKDRTKPSLDTLLLIARRLGTSVDALLGQQSHLPELVCEGLLSLSRDAIAAHETALAGGLLRSVSFVAGRYRLDEAAREASLQSAQIAIAERRLDEALGLLDEAGPACEAAGDLWRLGRAQLLRGTAHARRGETAQAIPLLEQALITLRRARAGRDPARLEALLMLGRVLGEVGSHAAALKRLEEAAASDMARRDPRARGRALCGMGLAHRRAGNVEAATRYLTEARRALEEAEASRELSGVVRRLGLLHFEQGRPKEALRHLHQARRMLDGQGDPFATGEVAADLARVYLSQRELKEADQHARDALEMARGARDPLQLAGAAVIAARIRVARKDAPGAIALYKEALEAFRRHGRADAAAAAARELGLLLRERGAHAEAAAYLAMSLEGGEGPRAPAAD